MNKIVFLFFAFGELRMGLFTFYIDSGLSFFFFAERKKMELNLREKNAVIAVTCNNRYF